MLIASRAQGFWWQLCASSAEPPKAGTSCLPLAFWEGLWGISFKSEILENQHLTPGSALCSRLERGLEGLSWAWDLLGLKKSEVGNPIRQGRLMLGALLCWCSSLSAPEAWWDACCSSCSPGATRLTSRGYTGFVPVVSSVNRKHEQGSLTYSMHCFGFVWGMCCSFFFFLMSRCEKVWTHSFSRRKITEGTGADYQDV